jgi:hypothetical protein
MQEDFRDFSSGPLGTQNRGAKPIWTCFEKIANGVCRLRRTPLDNTDPRR